MNQEIEKIKKKTLLELAFLVASLNKYQIFEGKKFQKLHRLYNQNEIEIN